MLKYGFVQWFESFIDIYLHFFINYSEYLMKYQTNILETTQSLR